MPGYPFAVLASGTGTVSDPSCIVVKGVDEADARAKARTHILRGERLGAAVPISSEDAKQLEAKFADGSEAYRINLDDSPTGPATGDLTP